MIKVILLLALLACTLFEFVIFAITKYNPEFSKEVLEEIKKITQLDFDKIVDKNFIKSGVMSLIIILLLIIF